MKSTSDSQTSSLASFLPDFCGLSMVLRIIIVGELLAIILTLTPVYPEHDRWSTLSLLSLFIQWVGLSSAMLLCLLRRFFNHHENKTVAITSYFILLINTLVFTEVAYQIISGFQEQLYSQTLDHQSFLLRTLTIAAIIYALLLRYLYMQQQWRQQIQAETQAKLEALQARIRPHFLFNTMNTIASLVHDQPKQAEAAIENFSDLLRVSLQQQQERITLEEELTLCHHYLEIEQLRLGERLQVIWAFPPEKTNIKVPPLIIQPLLENAVYHGIETISGRGEIKVRGQINGNQLLITITNPIGKSTARTRQGHQMALENIHQRLILAYGDKANLAANQDDHHYTAIMTLPITGSES